MIVSRVLIDLNPKRSARHDWLRKEQAEQVTGYKGAICRLKVKFKIKEANKVKGGKKT